MSIIYFDTSALVKKYVLEPGSDRIGAHYARAEMVGTALITAPEMASALSRAMRMDKITADEASQSWNAFTEDCDMMYLVDISQPLISRASTLVWEHGLRGNDAVHLASFLTWKEALGEEITLATFDAAFWQAARRLEIEVLPENLS